MSLIFARPIMRFHASFGRYSITQVTVLEDIAKMLVENYFDDVEPRLATIFFKLGFYNWFFKVFPINNYETLRATGTLSVSQYRRKNKCILLRQIQSIFALHLRLPDL